MKLIQLNNIQSVWNGLFHSQYKRDKNFPTYLHIFYKNKLN